MRTSRRLVPLLVLVLAACGGGDGANGDGGGDSGANAPDATTDDAGNPAPDGAATTDATDDAPPVADANNDALDPDAGDPDSGGGGLTCISCHGSAKNPAPPIALNQSQLTTDPGVGAHQSHLGVSTWHHEVQCTECHPVPQTPYWVKGSKHRNGVTDLVWGAIAKSGTYANLNCTGSYCHGASLKADKANTVSNRTPAWTTVNGTQAACGTSCHTLPPGGGHPQSTACDGCHSKVISAFTMGNPPSVTWKDPTLHIDGKVDLDGNALSCTTCHGDVNTNDPSPPRGTNGETLTSQAAVGAHQKHLGQSSSHRNGACTDCHAVPQSTSHSNGVTDFAWGAVSTANNAQPAYANTTCSGVYCHGTTLAGPIANGQVSRAPVWNVVNGSYSTCGNTCHTNPPGGGHPPMTNCATCHGAVIASFNANNQTATWTNAQLHVDGTLQVIPMTCTTCHGTGPNQVNPPTGTGGESTNDTLAVGRHVAHLTSSATHLAFACNTCHVVPPANDLAHTAEYVPTANLLTAGHHGDVTFANQGVGTTWNVSAVQGNVTARGTCIGACHSNGRGGAPLVTPYWAGGAWNTGSCASCHPGTMSTLSLRHPKHNGEATCADCHPPANSATHMNGSHDVFPTITGSGQNGGSVNVLPPGAQGNNCPQGQWQCTGTCHGQSHNPKCWGP